jgi:hypothetical protein
MKRRRLWAACVVLIVGVAVLAVGAGYAKAGALIRQSTSICEGE